MIYVVFEHGGQWEDAWQLPVIAVRLEERAKEIVEEYSQKWSSYARRMEDLVDDDLEHEDNPDEPEMCMDDCLACEVDEYRWEPIRFYTYESVKEGT